MFYSLVSSFKPGSLQAPQLFLAHCTALSFVCATRQCSEAASTWSGPLGHMLPLDPQQRRPMLRSPDASAAMDSVRSCLSPPLEGCWGAPGARQDPGGWRPLLAALQHLASAGTAPRGADLRLSPALREVLASPATPDLIIFAP